ncbi:MAG: DegT/DnrJ/EryC1/StrS family aminotransferase [Candidatus Omnitrophota bacterium]
MKRKKFLPLSKPLITSAEIDAVSSVLRSGYLTTGPKVEEFEKGVEKYLGGSVHAVALNSCTGGLFLALNACGIGPGDEVIVPTWTFAASAHVVIWTGAKPVLCDVDEGSLNIDVRRMKELISARTKAIMPVHFAGYPCEMDEITAVARRRGMVVIEDAAHAIGSVYNGRKIGTIGDATVFSFYATKNLACGEGGMVVSEDEKMIERIRKASYFGIDKEAFSRYRKAGRWYYEIEELGYKYNMDSIHAAIGIVQLKKLNAMSGRRRRIARLYRAHLDDRIRFMTDGDGHYHTYHLFPIRIDRRIIGRNDLIEKLKERNIGAGVHFIPLHRHPYYRSFVRPGEFPVADKAYEEIISIPMFAGMSDGDAWYVIRTINDILKRR